MKFLIITHVPHIKNNKQYFAYAPYIREMNIWLKHVNEVVIVAPVYQKQISEIDLHYTLNTIDFRTVPSFELTSAKQIIATIFKLPKLLFEIFKSMKSADHIHLRCPGNMGLLGSMIQILFPSKKKSAKYAGNWDPKSKQPWSYRLQKWILSNTLLTKNMQVLVYGEWENQTKNIKPFFTASYFKNEIVPLKSFDNQNKLRFVFAGSLVSGKNPVYALALCNALKKQLLDVQFDIYGDGILRTELQHLIVKDNLQNEIFLHGNQNSDVVKQAFQKSHFVLLPSKSEGWPKVIAEGMFWGCVPIATPVSCVSNMLDHGNRGIILTMDVERDAQTIKELIQNQQRYQKMRREAATWSRMYTLDYFESEILKIIQS